MFLLAALLQIVGLLTQILIAIFIVQMVLSVLVAFNVVNMYNEFVRRLMEALDKLTQPMLRPIRRLLPDMGGLDFSPMVLIFGLYGIQILLNGAIRQLQYMG